MIPEDLIRDVYDYVASKDALGVGCATGVDGLFAVGNPEQTSCDATFYEPIMCLVLQGAKEAHVGGRVVRYGAGDTLIVSHAVPLEAAVIRANRDEPYTALALKLDLEIARSLVEEISDAEDEAAPGLHTVGAATSDRALIDAVARLFRISSDPVETQALAPLILREIHFRLLRARHGGMLRQLLRLESPASRVARAISLIRENFRNTLPVAELAAESGMSASAFHEHFKTVTSTTPLQYQKELRLLEARRMLMTGQHSVASAAFDVGYESPTQFSREFSRKFGLSPSEQKAGGQMYQSA